MVAGWVDDRIRRAQRLHSGPAAGCSSRWNARKDTGDSDATGRRAHAVHAGRARLGFHARGGSHPLAGFLAAGSQDDEYAEADAPDGSRHHAHV